jgi:ribonuclease BN (tRNA processing enzyme)
MKLIILGSGTFVPELKRNSSSYLVEIGKERLIFDFGRGSLTSILKLKISLDKINKIFISHLHVDHLAELSSFLFYFLYRPKAKKYPDIFIYGPKGIKKTMNLLFKAYHINNHKYLDKIKIKELSDKDFVKGKNWKIKAFKVKHAKKLYCLAYRLESGKKVFCYSGDTAYCKGIKNACKNTDLALIEASLPEKLKIKEHLTGKKAGKIAKQSRVKKLIITHVAGFYLSDVIKDVKKYYKEKVILAKDLKKIKI